MSDNGVEKTLPSRERWNQIESLFHEALETAPEQRTVWLARHADGDEELRLEVESLLAEAMVLECLLERPALEFAARLVEAAEIEDASPRRIGDFDVGPIVGHGQLGAIYRAHDRRMGRPLALQMVPSAIADDPQRLWQFTRGARLLMDFEHPNVAACYGVIASAGVQFLAWEWLDGESLTSRMRAGRIDADEVLAVGRILADVLHAAHARDIVHGDLQPSVVRVCPDGMLKVQNFRLPWSTNDLPTGHTDDDRRARHAHIDGVSRYWSPERVDGGGPSPADDVWALGVLLFEIAAGNSPFGGQSADELGAAIVTATPEWSRIPETLPPHLTALLSRILRKDRRKRLTDARAIGVHLSRWRRPDAAGSRVARWADYAQRWLRGW